MINIFVIREDEYEFVSNFESKPDDIKVHYSYDLNVNYVDIDTNLDSEDLDYDTPKFLVCMNNTTPLYYSQQALQLEIKAREALDEGNVSRYIFYMNESKKDASKAIPINKKNSSQKFIYTKSSMSPIISMKERIGHLMDIIRNAQQKLEYLLSIEAGELIRMIEEFELVQYQNQQLEMEKEVIQYELEVEAPSNSPRNYVQYGIDGQIHEV